MNSSTTRFLFFFLLLFSISGLLQAQVFVTSDDGGRLEVSIASGDGGGGNGDSGSLPLFCVSPGTCESIVLEGWPTGTITVMDQYASPYGYITASLRGQNQDGHDVIEICADAKILSGKFYLDITRDVSRELNQEVKVEPAITRIKVWFCVSQTCPICDD